MKLSTREAPLPGWEDHLQTLHRFFFDAADDTCLLWVNPAQGDPFLGNAKVADAMIRVPIGHPRFDPAFAPYLLPLQLDRSADAQVFKASVALAWDAWTLDSLQAANGQPICGWISATCGPERLARHWADSCHLHVKDGLNKLLRFHDPSVREWLWPTLTPLQRRQILGPATSVTALDRYQGLMFHDAAVHAPSADGKQLVLDRQQWSQIENCSIVHAAFLRAYSESRRQDASAMPPQLHEQEVFLALEQASGYGIDDAEDRILFATHAIQLGHKFHTSEKLQAVWAMTAAGSYYGAALEDVSGKPADQLHEFISTPA